MTQSVFDSLIINFTNVFKIFKQETLQPKFYELHSLNKECPTMLLENEHSKNTSY